MGPTTTASGAHIIRITPDLLQVTEPFTGNTCYLARTGSTWTAQTLPRRVEGHGDVIGRYSTLAEALDCL